MISPVIRQEPTLAGRPRDLDVTWGVTILLRPALFPITIPSWEWGRQASWNVSSNPSSVVAEGCLQLMNALAFPASPQVETAHAHSCTHQHALQWCSYL